MTEAIQQQEPVGRPGIDTDVDNKVYTTFIRLAFTPYTIHFKSPRYMLQETLDRIDHRIVKETVRLTSMKAYIRTAIGTSRPFWEDMVTTFRAAVTSLERRSFQQWDPSSVDYESTSSSVLAAAHPGLWKDLERLHDLLSVGRNVLVVGAQVQDLCADCEFDQVMFKLINCCVRVTARGYDGETGTGEEEKWQQVIHAYKRLLITSLQVLNNLSAKNETRKLRLWASLFDSGEAPVPEDQHISNKAEEPVSVIDAAEETPPQPKFHLVRHVFRHRSLSESDAGLLAEKPTPAKGDTVPPSVNSVHNIMIMSSSFFTWGGYSDFCEAEEIYLKEEQHLDLEDDVLAKELARRWLLLPDTERRFWTRQRLRRDEQDQAKANSVDGVQLKVHPISGPPEVPRLRVSKAHKRDGVEAKTIYDLTTSQPSSPTANIRFEAYRNDPYTMTFSADAAARVLQSGKDDLLRRVTTYPSTDGGDSPNFAQSNPAPIVESPSESEHSGEEDEYRASAEDGRGLLTDVPLILGPSEIEILPNMIMSGLVPAGMPNATKEQIASLLDSYGSRCHLLLSHDNGRNLLRELLIFVAAWDLRDEELYFKFMVRIIEAILINDLLPYAYQAFKDHSKLRSKDIISPAQAVIMKLLTNLFRQYAEANKSTLLESGNVREPATVDVQVVKFIFTQFRQYIVPQTCALIFLQGKIHDNTAPQEDFPLNLWDMERMYEGVYQYLEFFAVLTEESYWKDIMAKWEVASELVTILKELEAAIPKVSPAALADERDDRATVLPPIPTQGPVATTQKQGPPTANSPPHAQTGVDTHDDLSPDSVAEGDEQLPYPPDEPQEEPSDFEWRNLKKLTVLVLSSLVWKNKTVQDQIRQYKGLEALVGCCRHDEHNPYIREHAIMCLRFAVENNAANAAVVKDMAEQFNAHVNSLRGGTVTLGALQDMPFSGMAQVPREVLDTQGYETFMDGKGQVGLRRKDQHPAPAPPPPPPQQPSTSAAAAAAAAYPPVPNAALQQAAAHAIAGAFVNSRTAGEQAAFERAAEIMKNALKEVPLPKSLSMLKNNQGLVDKLNKIAPELMDLVASAGGAAAAAKSAGAPAQENFY